MKTSDTAMYREFESHTLRQKKEPVHEGLAFFIRTRFELTRQVVAWDLGRSFPQKRQAEVVQAQENTGFPHGGIACHTLSAKRKSQSMKGWLFCFSMKAPPFGGAFSFMPTERESADDNADQPPSDEGGALRVTKGNISQNRVQLRKKCGFTRAFTFCVSDLFMPARLLSPCIQCDKSPEKVRIFSVTNCGIIGV